MSKGMRNQIYTYLFALLSLFFTHTAQAAIIELITNGDFETGDFTGWTSTDLLPGTGQFLIDTPGTSTPISGNATAPNPTGGNFYAVSDQVGPGTHAIEQTFVVPFDVITLTLTFDLFVNNQAGATIIDPMFGLDHTGLPNQHGRVDILSAGSTAFDTGAGVLNNLFIGADPIANNPNPYVSYQFDLTGLLAPSGAFDLRFAETDNQLFFNLGVDNISLIATTVPEPNILFLFGAGLILIVFTRRSLKQG